jgi:hypothetical protein
MAIAPDVAHRRATVAGLRSGEARRERRDVIARIVKASRAAQGLSETVEDLAVLEHVAALLETGAPDAAV